jgi:hypothetical protein
VIEIWLADWVFTYKLRAKEMRAGITAPTFTVNDVITKRIPTRFLLNEGESYKRATEDMLKTFYSSLEDDKETGLKKFKIIYTKKIGEVNDNRTNRNQE